MLFRIRLYIFSIFCKIDKKIEGVFHCVLLILGAKFDIPNNVSHLNYMFMQL